MSVLSAKQIEEKKEQASHVLTQLHSKLALQKAQLRSEMMMSAINQARVTMAEAEDEDAVKERMISEWRASQP